MSSYEPDDNFETSRFKSRTRRMEERGVDCGDIGGNRDWNIVVVRDSRCLGTAEFEPSWAGGVVKLFITSSGGARYSFPPPLGYFIAFWMSLHREYRSTRK